MSRYEIVNVLKAKLKQFTPSPSGVYNIIKRQGLNRLTTKLQEDLIRETTFDSIEEFKEQLLHYLYYYNHERPHQALGGISPVEFSKNCQRIT